MITETSSDLEIIDTLVRLHGNQKNLAVRFKIAPENITHWKNRGIPAKYRYSVFAMLREFKINLNAEKFMSNK